MHTYQIAAPFAVTRLIPFVAMCVNTQPTRFDSTKRAVYASNKSGICIVTGCPKYGIVLSVLTTRSFGYSVKS